MLQIDSETKQYFNQDKEYVLSYLKSRSVNDTYYFNLIVNNDFGFLKDNTIYVDNEPYAVDAFCTCSSNSGYDIKGVNENLGTNEGFIIVIAGVRGDDVICFNISTGEIFLWLIESGDFEKKHIADSFQSFIEMIKYE